MVTVATEQERGAALEILLARLSPAVREQRITSFEQWFRTGSLDPNGLLVSREGEAITGAILLQRNVGNCVNVGMPRTRNREASIELALAQGARQHLESWKVAYGQVTLEPVDNYLEKCFKQAGFQYLTLLEFYRLNSVQIVKPTWPDGIQLKPVQQHETDLFIRTLFETYLETTDCPELNGIRSEKDVLSEYQYLSYFPPKWWLLYEQNNAIGVLILSPGSESSCELSYFGLVPKARRQGLGKLLVKQALHEAEKLAKSVTVSVDERNQAARQLYLREGFQLYQLRRILWWHVSSPSQ
jgi:mycothiol synthase